jgi:hypothetical protein
VRAFDTFTEDNDPHAGIADDVGGEDRCEFTGFGHARSCGSAE